MLAANPCPCGTANDVACTCSVQARRRYTARLSGPLMDRIDLRVRLGPVGAAALHGAGTVPESSACVLARVVSAREAAAQRWRGNPFHVNARVPGTFLRTPPFRLPRTATAELTQRVDRGSLSARGYDRVLRLAWSISDLDGRNQPTRDDVAEALDLRTGEAP